MPLAKTLPAGITAVSDYPAVSSGGDFVAFRSDWPDPGNFANAARNTLLSLRKTCVDSSQSCQTGTTPLSFVSAGEDGGTSVQSQALASSGRYLAIATFSVGFMGERSGSAYILDTCANTSGCEPSDVYDIAFEIFSGIAISASGRFVAVDSDSKIVLQDSCLGASQACTPGTVWTGNHEAGMAAIAGEGRYLVFDSTAFVVPADSNGASDIFWTDTCVGAGASCSPQTLRISVGQNGAESNGSSRAPVVSTDGRFVAFESDASNLVAGDTNGVTDVFLADTCLGSLANCTPNITRLSIGTDGTDGNGASSGPSISADGRFVAFVSAAGNLVSTDTNGAKDIFVRDTCTHVAGCTPGTTLVSLAFDHSQGGMPTVRGL